MKLKSLLLALILTLSLSAVGLAQYQEAPILKERVAAGELPPVEERLPKNPLVVEAPEIGRYGGIWDGNQLGDFRYANWVTFVRVLPDLSWEKDLAEEYEVSEDLTTFKFKIREGIKWSDGHP